MRRINTFAFSILCDEKELSFKHNIIPFLVHGGIAFIPLALCAVITIIANEMIIKIFCSFCTVFFLALILCRLLSAIYNKWVINENGVFYQTLFSKKFLSWDKISDIGICCYKDPDIPLSSSRNHVGNPVEIAIYFSKRHLTEYEQKNFFTKHLCVMKELTIFKKMIFVTVPLTEDVENTFELVAKFCTKYTSLPITRFNSFILKYK